MSRIATLVLAALAAAAPALAQTPDRSKAPVPGPAPALSLPPIVKRTLSNGLPVWILERHKVPLVHVTLLVKAGAAADPAGKAGLASVTADLEVVSESGGVLTPWQLQETLAFSGPDQPDVIVEIDENDRATVVFGVAVPPAGAPVRATYRVGGGRFGNVAPGTITTIAGAPELTLRAARVTNPSGATGGADRESIDHAADIAPRVFRSLRRVVTGGDYEALAARYSGVGKVRAAALGWNTVTLFVAPEGGGAVSDVLAADLITYFEDKRPLSTRIEIRDVAYVPVFLTAELEVEPYHARTRVTEQVRAALAGLLAFDAVRFGDVVYLSKFYEAAEAVPGVAGVNISEFRVPGQAAVVEPTGKLVLGRRDLPRVPTVDDFDRHPDHAPPADYPGGIQIRSTGGY